MASQIESTREQTAMYRHSTTRITILVSLGLVIAGCGGDYAKESRHQMWRLFNAIFAYQETHKGELPDRLEDVIQAPFFSEEDFKEAMVNPLTGDNPGYEYVKPTGKWLEPGFDKSQV